jgi:hypothetical protein
VCPFTDVRTNVRSDPAVPYRKPACAVVALSAILLRDLILFFLSPLVLIFCLNVCFISMSGLLKLCLLNAMYFMEIVPFLPFCAFPDFRLYYFLLYYFVMDYCFRILFILYYCDAFCSLYYLCITVYVLFVVYVTLPPGISPIAVVNIYIYKISFSL